MSNISWLITDGSVTVNYDGETHIVRREEALADRLIQALKDGKQEDIPSLVSAAKRIEAFSNGNFTVKNGVVMVNGVEAPKVLSDKIIKFSNEGLPYMPLVNFAERLQANPSFRAVNELFGFLEKNDHPITSDGHFLAFKRVRGDFKDIHSGTFDNSPGQVVEMPRNQVNEDCNQVCAQGLHVAAFYYAHMHFASSNPETDVIVEVKVDPADVVSVPIDYQNSKMRVSKYEVLGVVTTPFDPKEYLRKTEPQVNDNQLESSDTCCSDGMCACPEDCGCDCNDEYCGDCPDNADNYDRCEECGDPDCYGSCVKDEEIGCAGACSNCKGCCGGDQSTNNVVSAEEPYPYTDELSFSPEDRRL